MSALHSMAVNVRRSPCMPRRCTVAILSMADMFVGVPGRDRFPFAIAGAWVDRGALPTSWANSLHLWRSRWSSNTLGDGRHSRVGPRPTKCSARTGVPASIGRGVAGLGPHRPRSRRGPADPDRGSSVDLPTWHPSPQPPDPVRQATVIFNTADVAAALGSALSWSEMPTG